METNTSISSVRTRQTDAARPSLAAVTGTHRFQAGCAHLPMSAWSGDTVTFAAEQDSQKIIKIVATRCHILKLKCIKFDFGLGSAPDPAGGAYSAPRSTDPLAGFKGAYF